MISTLKRLLEYDSWAAQRTLESVQSLAEPNERCIKLFSHLVASRQRWLGMIEGQDISAMDTWPTYSLEECERYHAELAGRLTALLGRVNHDDLAQSISFTNPKGENLEFRWGDTLLHSLLHSQYHRAQIATAVREAGGTPASTDYIVFCKEEFLNKTAGAGGR